MSIEVVLLPIKGDVVAAPIDGTGAVAPGLGAGPAPFLAGAEKSKNGAEGAAGAQGTPLLRALGTMWTAPQARRLQDFASPKVPSSTPSRARALPAGWGHRALQTPDLLSRTHCPLSAWDQGQPGPATHHVLQSTLILSPGEYSCLLCIQVHFSSVTQPPRPSSICPSGHTQPLMHSVWYWGQPDNGVQGFDARPALPLTAHLTLQTPLTPPPTPDLSPWPKP